MSDASPTPVSRITNLVNVNPRAYFLPRTRGKYSFPFWSTLEQTYTSPNIDEILLEEIALEGLDGITLQALWERLKVRLHTFVKDEDTCRYFWNIIKKNQLIKLYLLPQSRGDLVPICREDYADDRGNTVEPCWAPEDIYIYTPINDKKRGIRGSCSTYKTRILKTKSYSSYSYEDIILLGNTMVMVAPQSVRESVLIGEDGEDEYQFTVAQYCMLERIGRARYEGEQTKGNVSLAIMKLETKSSFHYRQDLIRFGFIKRQTYAMKFAGGKTTAYVSILHLPRFFTVFDSVAIKNVKKLILELRMNPTHMGEYFKIQKTYGKQTMKFVTDKMLSDIFEVKEETNANLYPEMYEKTKHEAKRESMRKRTVRMVYLKETIVPEGEIDKVLRVLQEKHLPASERIDEEDSDMQITKNQGAIISDNESMFYTLLMFIHKAGGRGVTIEEISRHFKVGKLDARTATRSIEKKKALNSYWEGTGRNKCRRYYLAKFMEDKTDYSISINLDVSSESRSTPNVVENIEADLIVENSLVAPQLMLVNVVGSPTTVQGVAINVDNYDTRNQSILGDSAVLMDTTEQELEVSTVSSNTTEANGRGRLEMQSTRDTRNRDKNLSASSNIKVRPHFVLTDWSKNSRGSTHEILEHLPVSSIMKAPEPTTQLKEGESVSKRQKKPAYDAVDNAAILRRRKQRVEWSAEEDHCILILYVSSVVFIPNYVLGKTFIFNAPQIRDILHKNIRDSGNKTQISVRRRLHFLMKLRKFNARYRYYLSATFSDDRLFKFIERHIKLFQKPGRGFIEVPISALSAVYTYITTHFVGVNCYNEEDENFVDAPSFPKLTAMRAYRRSEISEEMINAEDDLIGEESERQSADALRQKEQKKEWNVKMCQIKDRQIHPTPELCMQTINLLLRKYAAIHYNSMYYENYYWNTSRSKETHLNVNDTSSSHTWRTFRKKTYWEKNLVSGVNEPRNVQEIIIWQIRSVLMRLLITTKNLPYVKKYLTKLPEYYLDYIIYSFREMEIINHSKRGRIMRISLNNGMLYRGPYPVDYEMSYKLNCMPIPETTLMLDEKTRWGTFHSINDWLIQNKAHFIFKYSNNLFGVKDDWKDAFQILISEEFGFKVYMKSSQKKAELLNRLVFLDNNNASENAECLEEFIQSICIPGLDQNASQESLTLRLSRLDNARRKFEFLSKCLAKFRRKKNKQVDWRVYLKRERDMKNSSNAENPRKRKRSLSLSSDDSDTSISDDTICVEDDTGTVRLETGDSGVREAFSKRILFSEMMDSLNSESDLKTTLRKINKDISQTDTKVSYAEEICKVIEEKLEVFQKEEMKIHELLQQNNNEIENPEKLKNINKVFPVEHNAILTLEKRLGSNSMMANEFLTMEEPNIMVRHETPEVLQWKFSGLQVPTDKNWKLDDSTLEFIGKRLIFVVSEEDVLTLVDSLKEENLVIDVKSERQKATETRSKVSVKFQRKPLDKAFASYAELFKMIRTAADIGVSLDFLKAHFSRDYLKIGLEDLMTNQFIAMVGVHTRKFISVEFIDTWSLPLKAKNIKRVNPKLSRRYIIHPWVTSAGKIKWQLIDKMFTSLLSYLESVVVTVDDLCHAMAPVLSTVETLILIECLAKMDIILLYKIRSSKKTTLWSKPLICQYTDRAEPYDSFLDLEDLSVNLHPQYYSRYYRAQVVFKDLFR